MILALLAALATSPAQCPAIEIAVETADMPASFGAEPIKQASANFAEAYADACAEGLLKDKALLGAGQARLFLFNAPEANIAVIYDREGRTILEYPFVTPDGAVNVPVAEELHEAIYCAVAGATEAEQEESGRCLPD
jgi:hypothetical protein